ncbi:regulatory protein, tetR family [Streptomyces melanosporofaciens]|uniref:Regulatory protein, tetR family n=1 Tax=Streptomyces melanosporofaciens TaxID=67327 RepID=A0A1H4KI49_STRMJ|nr:regulatory protein, tetR family [Streptomyces melanosporofaciens]
MAENTPVARRDQILNAALEVIAEHGAISVTYRKIAAAADVLLGSLTYYFDGMQHLLTEAFTASPKPSRSITATCWKLRGRPRRPGKPWSTSPAAKPGPAIIRRRDIRTFEHATQIGHTGVDVPVSVVDEPAYEQSEHAAGCEPDLRALEWQVGDAERRTDRHRDGVCGPVRGGDHWGR